MGFYTRWHVEVFFLYKRRHCFEVASASALILTSFSIFYLFIYTFLPWIFFFLKLDFELWLMLSLGKQSVEAFAVSVICSETISDEPDFRNTPSELVQQAAVCRRMTGTMRNYCRLRRHARKNTEPAAVSSNEAWCILLFQRTHN